MERIDSVIENSTGIEPKAIKTTYRGVQYRSRLEARWAVFFDELGIEHAFEYEGFDLPSGWYVPDFWLPKMSCWIEIKPTEPTYDSPEVKKCDELSRATQSRVFLAFGGFDHSRPRSDMWCFDPAFTDTEYMFCECGKCGRIGIHFEGRGARVCGLQCYPDYDRGHSGEAAKILDAYDHARSFSFWSRF